MKFFKKEGKFKLKHVEALEEVEGLIENGWYECTNMGVKISDSKPKKESYNKSKGNEGE
tara:strand:+ start:63 stop:239 length:177 start_codon:yes stop_codon:yes gene_type:complete